MKFPSAASLAMLALAMPFQPVRAQVCVNPAGPTEFAVKGDLNGSGGVNVADSMCALLAVGWTQAGGQAAPPGCLQGSSWLADLNCSNSITVADVQLTVGLALLGALPAAVDGDSDGCADACVICPDSLPFACIFGSSCVLEGAAHPSLACRQCAAGSPLASFVTQTDGTPCGANLVCISGACQASPPPTASGSFGSDLHVAPSSQQTSDAITLSGFFGAVNLSVQGDAATIEVNSGTGFQPSTTAMPGNQVRLVMTAASGLDSPRTARIVAPGFQSSDYVVRTWFFTTGSTTSFGACNGPCSSTNGTRTTATWTCNRSDGTSGHAQSNCPSPNESQSCTTSSCFNSNPPSFPSNGSQTPTVSFGTANFTIQCSNDGGSLNSLTLQVTAGGGDAVDVSLLTVSTGRVGAGRVFFQSTSSGIGVSSFQAGTSQNSFKQHMCYQPSAGTCSAVNVGGVFTDNCSSPISCRIQRQDGTTWWFARGVQQSQAYMTSSAFRSARESDNACLDSNEWVQQRAQFGVNGVPCYNWQPGCPFN
jgi:hypothetical protein